ncbi:MAG: restriction endonuclease subunit R [Anaerolineaceae bacterium 4572_78]|nr:MAG: restriction endonuclease subunit R [Anaerolineaceae bacterium 4572_78]
MSNSILAKDVTLYDLETKFSLQFTQDTQFFPEWQVDLSAITTEEKIFLDTAKGGYINLIRYPSMLEDAVKLTVLSPLLNLSNLLLPPFHMTTETSIYISSSDEDTTIEGRIDILVLKENLWILVIESKRAELSLKVGLAQVLAYMLANPTPQKPCFGLLTNGGSYIFLKLVNKQVPVYGMSRVFDLLNPGNDLYHVLSILKNIKQLALDEVRN